MLSGDSMDLEHGSGTSEFTPHALPSPAASGAVVAPSATAAGVQPGPQQLATATSGTGSVEWRSSGGLPESPFTQAASGSIPSAPLPQQASPMT